MEDTSLKMKLSKAIKEDLLVFCSNSDIHGLAKIADHRKSRFSRFFWLMVVVVFFIFSGIYIQESIHGKGI
jgi:hypothetical protein